MLRAAGSAPALHHMTTASNSRITKASTYPAWRGFEWAPTGRLLAQVVEISGAMGIAYERSIGFRKDYHVHDRDMLVCPRGASEMRIRTRTPRRATYAIDSDSILFVPKTAEHDDEAVSTVYDTFALYPADTLVAAVLDELGLDRTLVEVPFQIRRSRWFSETLERYFAERVLERRRVSPDLSFLERELVAEAVRSKRRARPKESVVALDELAGAEEGILARALRIIEANLFESIDLPSLAKRSGASVSTLLRTFRRDLETTPYAYVKARRLDEAKRLLRRGHVQVKEVALLVGYDDLPAFSKAFKGRFGVSPRTYRTQPS